jgi:hypothetical protein
VCSLSQGKKWERQVLDKIGLNSIGDLSHQRETLLNEKSG